MIAWKRSGRSARDYAAEHGLKAANLYAWSKKKRAGRRERACGSPFVPVRIAPDGFSGREPRVTLKTGGLECMIEGADGPEALAAPSAALKREVFDVYLWKLLRSCWKIGWLENPAVMKSHNHTHQNWIPKRIVQPLLTLEDPVRRPNDLSN